MRLSRTLQGFFLTIVIARGALAAPIVDPADPAFGPAPTVVDFESAAPGIYPAYSGGLIVATPVGAVQLVGARLAVTSTYSAQYNMTGQYVSSEGYLFRNLIVTFPTPVTAFGFHMGLTSQPWDLLAYDADGNVVETVTVPALLGSSAGDFHGVASMTPIVQAILVVQLPVQPGPQWVVVDDLRFAPVEAIAGADLAVSALRTGAAPRVGRRLSFRVTVENGGPEIATSATLAVDLAGLVPAEDGAVSAPRGCVVSGTTVTCALGDLRPGARVRRTIRVVPDAPGTIVLTASASSAVPDPNARNSVAVVSVSVP